MTSATDKSRHRDYCFTLNNWTLEEHTQLESLSFSLLQYSVYGKEICPSTGTPHLQCYIYFSEAKTWSSVRKKLPKRCANIMARYDNSNPYYASMYCKKGIQSHTEWEKFKEHGPNFGKDADYFEHGILPQVQGKRNDLDDVRKAVLDGENMRQISLKASGPQAVRMAEILLKYHEPERDFRPDVYWFWGESGSFKTTHAKKFLGPGYYMVPRNFKFWEGYDAHDNILFDEIRKGYMTFAEFLVLVDENPFRMECKGGSRQLLAKKIVFTSPFHPCKVFEDDIMRGEESYQIIRRFKKIVQFKRPEHIKLIDDNDVEYYDGMEF